MVLDIRVAPGSQNVVIVTVFHRPIKMWTTPLVINDTFVFYEIWGPWREIGLCQVTCQYLEKEIS